MRDYIQRFVGAFSTFSYRNSNSIEFRRKLASNPDAQMKPTLGGNVQHACHLGRHSRGIKWKEDDSAE